jgi:ribosomal-protein-alanine N-acetyltransferase
MTDAAATRLPLPVLQGERCVLRPLVAGDAVSLRAHADNVAVARRMLEGFPSPYTDEAAQAWCAHEANSGEFGYVWGVVAKGETGDASDAAVGCIGLKPEKGWTRCNAELGYWLGESYWRRGIVSDAVRQVTDWAFAVEPDIMRIFASVFASNEASQALVRKCGFVREGVLKQSAIKDGQVIDRVLWASYRAPVERRAADIDAALAISANIAMERS